jgi:hypothetical protein
MELPVGWLESASFQLFFIKSSPNWVVIQYAQYPIKSFEKPYGSGVMAAGDPGQNSPYQRVCHMNLLSIA